MRAGSQKEPVPNWLRIGTVLVKKRDYTVESGHIEPTVLQDSDVPVLLSNR
ncbi:Hypothetical protein SMAX5B_017080 [Scophthalmus maximus]|uniref:Uncharacterized protein n=1 Tax=Scophthalmus maximus TaxID=52904 RepID=A0A2U9D1M8_SCOMX|nr:Hypothetical protein SMAX5B_017080 [Scophthalmus maximus]